MPPVRDHFGRPLRSLRISVTDRCNLRCQYCMPEMDYVWLPREELLSFEEIEALATIFVELGVEKFRVTGGEPLLRRDLHLLIRRLAALGPRDLALTTNGVLLGEQAELLAQAGLRRVTVSLDTLQRDRFRQLAGRDELSRVLHGIGAANRAGLGDLKFNAVVIRGVNDDEIESLLDFARSARAEMRFIEYMDVGGATRWNADHVVARNEIIERVSRRFGRVIAEGSTGAAPAERFLLPDGTRFGVIASTTDPFCRDCDRARITADGEFFTCLYAREGVNLRDPLRAGATPAKLAASIREVWERRTDRGAEERLTQRQRGPFVPLDALRKNVHLEMHTRGG